MKIYTVIENTSYNEKPIRHFTSMKKALTFINAECNGIDCISNGKRWTSKKYCDEIKWSEALLSRKNLEVAHYMHMGNNFIALVSYTIITETVE